MGMVAIKLVGCETYHYFPKKKNFTKGVVNVVSEGEAAKLLAQETDQGMPYFVQAEMPDLGDAEETEAAKPKRKTPARKKPKKDPDPVIEDDEGEDTEGAIEV